MLCFIYEGCHSYDHCACNLGGLPRRLVPCLESGNRNTNALPCAALRRASQERSRTSEQALRCPKNVAFSARAAPFSSLHRDHPTFPIQNKAIFPVPSRLSHSPKGAEQDHCLDKKTPFICVMYNEGSALQFHSGYSFELFFCSNLAPSGRDKSRGFEIAIRRWYLSLVHASTELRRAF